MSTPTLHFVNCPDAPGNPEVKTTHRVAVHEWGDAANPHVVVCMHGLTRQGRDFDVLARALAPHRRVVCVDVAGRGQSDWFADPMKYAIPFYAQDMMTVVASLKAQTLDWVGTSMGGLIGMAFCGHPELQKAFPVRKLILNDVGPALAWSAIERIGSYVGRDVSFASIQEGADYMWSLSSSFGPHTPEQWMELSRYMLKFKDGRYVLHYDPAIGVPFRSVKEEEFMKGEPILWGLYDNIKAQTLLTRGANSDLVTPDTAQQMAQRGPKARVVEFEGVGHAPTFVAQDQLSVVTEFLLS
jgi:pimeloyl-ACP methyl ester carboxylesterase